MLKGKSAREKTYGFVLEGKEVLWKSKSVPAYAYQCKQLLLKY